MFWQTLQRLMIVGIVLTLAGCGQSLPRFLTVDSEGKKGDDVNVHQLSGIASYYANEFQGRKTSNGEVYNQHNLTAAHRTLPFNSVVRVRNLENGKEVVVRINDRGPFKRNRVIDLSFEAAKQIGLIAQGTAQVEIQVLESGSRLE